MPGPPIVKQLALAAWGIGATLAAERLLFSRSVPAAVTTVGFVRCRRAAVLVALAASAPMWLVIPLVGWLTGSPASVRADWPAVLAGVVIVNGITEEALHRGFVFNHVRRHRSFGGAAVIGAAVFAAQHLYLILTLGWVAGVSSVMLAALLTIPLSFMFEAGGNSIAAPAILHTSSNAPMSIFVSPSGPLTQVLVPYMAVVLVSIYLVFLFRGSLERQTVKTPRPAM
jgi:membrane protease YdiL (CAAX protease family)